MLERDLVLARGDTFALFDRHGDFPETLSGPHGLFHDGTRFLSLLALRLDGRRPLLLSSGLRADGGGLSIHATDDRQRIHICGSIELGASGAQLQLELRSYARELLELELVLAYAADYADVFEVRGVRRAARGTLGEPLVRADSVELSYTGLDRVTRRTQLGFAATAPLRLDTDRALVALSLRRGERATLGLRIDCELSASGQPRSARFSLPGAMRRAAPPALLIESSSPAFDAWLRRSALDLAMLTAETAHGPFPYAGAPWFSTPFGRDALVTAYEVLWLDPGLARGVLRFLAAHQADWDRPADDAEPGKIAHELRGGEMAALGEVPFAHYYGSADATPWFLLLAGAYHERTSDDELMLSLWPHFERALEWIDGPGDPDGDGFVEYLRRSPRGLANQGWKDSHDAIAHADGSLAQGPIALCEVQGYVYAAKLGIARAARRLGKDVLANQLEREARKLREAFERAFWCEELASYALALDGEKRPCRVKSSNAGHALLAGISSPERSAALARTLLSEELFSGWGVRTLSASAARFNPMSYHNGSVWPHDSALVAHGLARSGAAEAASRIFEGLFDAARAIAGARLPELICGFPRAAQDLPILYPVACSPQAWSAGCVFLLLQSLLGLSVDARSRQVRLSRPTLPSFLDRLTVRGLAVGGAELDLAFERTERGVDAVALRRTGEVHLVVADPA